QVSATFRSATDIVSMAVIVRDGGGRLVTGLGAQDFEVTDRGVVRPIQQVVATHDADARLALLVDSSGSMQIGTKPERTRLASDSLIKGLRADDAAAVFSFDSDLRRLTEFTTDRHQLRGAISGVVPYGLTCLFDAIVATARSVQAEAPRARAVVLLTDGIDTASLYSGEDAATAAARLDLPVYVIGVGRLAGAGTDSRRRDPGAFSVADLARRTGGFSGDGTSAAQLNALTQSILDELRHQYVVAFAAGSEPGWHQLQLRVKRGKVNARSRDGYLVH
ncbi:MAG: VWA domain-containing protein, partial [Vicinamibacterales bacterium]